MTLELKPFRIDDLQVDFPIALAPLAGYSDMPFRRLCRQMGCDYATSEMMLDSCVAIQSKQQMSLIAFGDDEHPLAGQLVGNTPETMAQAAKLVEAQGFDVVDLNFACPVNKALRRKRGGRLMDNPELAIEIIHAVVDAVDVPVTIKNRQRYNRDDTEEHFWQMAEGARDAGCAMLTAHGRSVEQKYTGPADWEFLKRVKAHFPDWTILGSGDVLSPRHAIELLDAAGLDGVVVARGVIGNPWFFRQCRAILAGEEPHVPTLAEQAEVMIQHFDASMEFYGEGVGCKNMRKCGIKYARNHPRARSLRVAFVDMKTRDDFHRILRTWYTDQYEGELRKKVLREGIPGMTCKAPSIRP